MFRFLVAAMWLPFACLLGACWGASEAGASEVVVDGYFTEEEWGDLAVAEVPEEGAVLMLREGDVASIGIRAPRTGLINVYLVRGDEIHVLHQSGALGRAIYQSRGDTWERVEDFSMHLGVRSAKPSPVAAKLRAKMAAEGRPAKEIPSVTSAEAADAIRAHLAEHGWTAYAGATRTSKAAELQVDFGPEHYEGFRFAIQWMDRTEDGFGVATWPHDAKVGADADVMFTLLGGTAPEKVAFETEGWASPEL